MAEYREIFIITLVFRENAVNTPSPLSFDMEKIVLSYFNTSSYTSNNHISSDCNIHLRK